MLIKDKQFHSVPYWYPISFLKEVRRGIPNNISQILRQTYDKYGTCFPNLDQPDVILGVNVQDCWSNTLCLSVRAAIHRFGIKAVDRKTQQPVLKPFDVESDKYNNPQTITDKLCLLNML